jgi:serine/threonine protein kinase/tetratricopeptide (TPR) repeat protein
MSQADPSRLRELFDRAAALPVDAREAWLAKVCPGDPELVRRVLGMLTGADDERFLAAPTGGAEPAGDPAGGHPADPPTAAVQEGPGSWIGPYRLLQQIGEGGFGIVFLAEQQKPVQRRVALKVVKLGMDTRQVIARFEQERQALALMDHPNIARVFDAGATATGRPYFVMELVKGAPIVEYCDQNQLTIDERLRLFAQVCQAVQHAHGKGVIHRDLKPANVLVGTLDGRPSAKVIDFGIAKATAQRLTEQTLFTEHQQVIGTLQYMSPEQAEGSLDIDTRTDVYSLGVLLYELLTGSTPFDKETIQGAMFGELRRLICETDPPRPSTRLSESRDALAGIAARRRIEPKRLGLLLRGDLDWIVMRALDKDRARRYGTASDLASDIQRHLRGDAVEAVPPSAAYRLRKLVRRHRGAVVVAAVLTGSVVIAAVGFAWLWQLAVAAEGQSQQRAAELARVVDFQDRMLAQVDAHRAGRALVDDVVQRLAKALAADAAAAADGTAKVATFETLWQRVNATDAARALIDRTILSPAVAAIEAQFADQPLVAARLRQTLASRYDDLGLPEAALPLLSSAVATQRQQLGSEHDDTLASLAQLAQLLRELGRLDEAEPISLEVLATNQRRHGDDARATLVAVADVGLLRFVQGRPNEAEPLLRDGLQRMRRHLGNGDADTITAASNLGSLLSSSGRLDEAEPLLREAFDGRRALHGEDHPSTLRVANHLAVLLGDAGRHAEAEPLLQQVLAGRRRVLGEDHPDTLVSINNLGMAMRDLRRWREAEALFREALERRDRLYGPGHVETLVPQNNLGLLLTDVERHGDAEPILRQVAEQRRRLLGPEHRETLTASHNLAIALDGLGRLEEAEQLTAQILATRRRVLGDDHVHTISSINSHATYLRQLERAAAAEPLAREAVERLQRLAGENHAYTLVATANLGVVLEALLRFDEAEECYRQAIARQEVVHGVDDPSTLSSVGLLATMLGRRGRHAEAKDLLEPRLAAARIAFAGSRNGSLARLLVSLAASRAALARTKDEFAAALALLQEADGIHAVRSDVVVKERRRCLQAFVDLYTAWAGLEPEAGHAAAAAEWRTRLEQLGGG